MSNLFNILFKWTLTAIFRHFYNIKTTKNATDLLQLNLLRPKTIENGFGDLNTPTNTEAKSNQSKTNKIPNPKKHQISNPKPQNPQRVFNVRENSELSLWMKA